MQRSLVIGGKHSIICELGILLAPNYMPNKFSRYHLFAHLFDGGFAPKLYARLKMYVFFVPPFSHY